MSSKVGIRATAITGQVIVGGGIATMMAGMSGQRVSTAVLVGMVIGEAGFMLSNVALTVAGTSGLADEQSGLAAGLLNTSIQAAASESWLS